MARTLAALSYLEYQLGNLEGARRIYDRVLEIRTAAFGPEHPGLAGTLYNLACLAALAGENEESLDFLHQAVERSYAGTEIFTDPDLDSLRGEASFDALLVRVSSRRSDT